MTRRIALLRSAIGTHWRSKSTKMPSDINPLTALTYSQKLATDVQQEIWTLYVLTKAIERLRYNVSLPIPQRATKYLPTSRTPDNQLKSTTSLLKVCKEVRKVALKDYTLRPCGHPTTFERWSDGASRYVNKTHDIFCFGVPISPIFGSSTV